MSTQTLSRSRLPSKSSQRIRFTIVIDSVNTSCDEALLEQPSPSTPHSAEQQHHSNLTQSKWRDRPARWRDRLRSSSALLEFKPRILVFAAFVDSGAIYAADGDRKLRRAFVFGWGEGKERTTDLRIFLIRPRALALSAGIFGVMSGDFVVSVRAMKEVWLKWGVLLDKFPFSLSLPLLALPLITSFLSKIFPIPSSSQSNNSIYSNFFFANNIRTWKEYYWTFKTSELSLIVDCEAHFLRERKFENVSFHDESTLFFKIYMEVDSIVFIFRWMYT